MNDVALAQARPLTDQTADATLAARAAEGDDGGFDAPRFEYLLGLFVLKQKPDAAHGLAEEEILIQSRKAKRRGGNLRPIGLFLLGHNHNLALPWRGEKAAPIC